MMKRRRRPRYLALGLLALVLFAIAIASAAGLGPAPRRGESSSSKATRAATTTSTTAGRAGEGPEGIPQPSGTGIAPRPPLAASRAFAQAWVNRPTSAAGQAEERRRLLSLSTGDLAARINFAFIQQGQGQGGNAGSGGRVIAVTRVGDHGGGRAVDVLVTTKEELTNGGAASQPPHYSLYLARLIYVGRGYLLTDWEPQ